MSQQTFLFKRRTIMPITNKKLLNRKGETKVTNDTDN